MPAPSQPAGRRDRGGCIREADDGHGALRQRWHEAQADARDHRQGPLRAGQQAAEVVAGVVLRHPRQPSHDRAVGQDRLEAEQLAAHRPMAKDVGAAGVGGDHPADRGRVPRAEIHAHVPAGTPRDRLYRGQRGARANRDLARVGIDILEGREPQRREHDLAASRHRAAHEAGVAALRNDADTGIRARAQHGPDLLRRTRTDHRRQRDPRTAASSPSRTWRADPRRPGSAGRRRSRGGLRRGTWAASYGTRLGASPS